MKKAITIIREFFDCPIQELKELTSEDRKQLAAAIARQNSWKQEECEFDISIAY